MSRAGSVSTVTAAGALVAARGVTVVGGSAFIADGTEIKRVDLATGAVSVLAGTAGSTSCLDAPSGAMTAAACAGSIPAPARPTP
jgi:hypothetical protein